MHAFRSTLLPILLLLETVNSFSHSKPSFDSSLPHKPNRYLLQSSSRDAWGGSWWP